MKKIYIILIIAFSLKAGNVQAQSVVNPGFEQLNYDGSISNWGNVYLMPMWIDSMGNSYSDSVVVDNQFYGPTNDAYNGNTALELRNAWDFTTNTGIAGAVGSDDDSVFSSWGLFNLVPTYSTPFNPFTPFNFGFYYKFFPVNGDSAFAQIALWDSSGNQLAEGILIITDSTSNYTLQYASINYLMNGDVAFYSFSIHNFYSADPGSHQPGFGTRLLVDNIGFNFASTGMNSSDNGNQITVYPNPANDKITVSVKSTDFFQISITNGMGQEVLKTNNNRIIDVSKLSPGVYFVKMETENKLSVRKFIKG